MDSNHVDFDAEIFSNRMEEAHNHMEEKDSTDGGSTCRAARRSLFQTSAGEYVNDPKDSSISSTASLGEVHGSGTDDGPKVSANRFASFLVCLD
jgi:hypothetical protein